MLNPTPLIVMRDEDPVVIRDGAVCGRLSGLEDATFTLDGAPADPGIADRIRGQVTAALAAIGTEGCTTYTPQGETLLATVVVDGQARADLNQTVLWVSPSDGYTVRP